MPAVKNNGYANAPSFAHYEASIGITSLTNYRFYSLVMNSVEFDEHGIPDLDAFFIASSNKFIIHGGPKLYPKEIAGVVVSTFVALALIFGASVVVARHMRKRRSMIAADLSEGNGERYTDAS